MEALDKIYLAFDKGFVAQASNVKEDVNGNSIFLPEYTPITYIRKDALLKYLRNEFAIVDFHLKAQDDPVWWGQRNAFQQVIDKIESL